MRKNAITWFTGVIYQVTAISIIIAFPILLTFWDFETGWNFETLEYQGFWTLNGFMRNLFFNGFHPVIPWSSFLLFGYWFGKQDLHNHKFIKKTFWTSTIVFIFIQVSLEYLSFICF